MAYQTTNWADGQTVHGTDINVWTVAVQAMGSGNQTTKSSGTATVTTTQVQMATYTIPASYLAVGTSYKIRASGTQSTTSGTLTYQIHIGTANTTADVVVATCAPAVAASGGAFFQGILTVRTTGAAGTCIAGCVGTGSTTLVSTNTATQTVNTTVQNFLTLTCAASAGTHTVQVGYISVAGA